MKNGFAIEITKDGRLRTRGLVEAGLHELSMRDPGEKLREAAFDLLRRTAAYQICEDDPFEDGHEMIDGSDHVRMRRAFDGTLEVIVAQSH